MNVINTVSFADEIMSRAVLVDFLRCNETFDLVFRAGLVVGIGVRLGREIKPARGQLTKPPGIRGGDVPG